MVAETELALVRDALAVLDAAGGVSAALQQVVDLVCERSGWAVGHAYMRHGGELVPTEVWHGDGRWEDFRRTTSSTRFDPGAGLPGRVLAEGRPVSVPDIAGDVNFPRAGVALGCGLGAALAVPVRLRGDIAAVLEFFAEPGGGGCSEVIELVATQLGRAWDRWLAEEELAGSEQRFRTVAETAQDGIVSADGAGAVQYANPAAERMFGYPAGAMAGLRLTALMPDRMRAEHRAGFARFVVTGQPKLIGGRAEVEALRADGTEFPIELSLAHDRTARGDTFTAIIRDLTEQRRTERFLRRTIDREEQAAAQLESLNEMKASFLTAVSHEMRTPLASVLGIAATLDRKPNLDVASQRTLLRQLADNAHRLDGLLEDLLDVDRLIRGVVDLRRSEEDVGALARRIVGQSGLAGRPVTLEVHNEPLVARVDVPKVERIIEHLLANIDRHTPPETAVWIRLGRAPEGLLLSVEDAGPGVPDAIKADIFEPFRQGESLRPHSPGTGLGLALVGRFAALHGGRAWVEDRPGGGAAFRVLLPA